MSNPLFGGKAKNTDIAVQSGQVGINTGFYPETLFEYVKDTSKEGNSYEGVKFAFNGPVTVNQMIFKPSKRTGGDRTQEEINEEFQNNCTKIDQTLLMYLGTYFPKDYVFDLPVRNSYEEYAEKFEEYIAAMRKYVPENAKSLSHDLLLGRGAGETYLSLPKSVRVTGRYVKLTDDASRELKESDIFKKSYKAEVKSETNGAVAPGTKPLTQVDWGV